jgi:hypothetical protein
VRNGRHGWRLARCKESSGAPELPPPIAATPSARRLSGCALVSCPPSSTRLGCFACATAATDSLALRARGEEEDNRTKPFDVMPPMGVDASCTGPCCCWLPGWGQRSPRWCARSPRISCKGSHGLSLAITYGGRNGRRREVKCSGAGGALDVWNPTNAHLLLPACSERDMISPRPRSFSIFLFGC